MKLTISLEARFFSTPDQKVWSDSGPDYFFWHRYLDVFGSVEIIARVQAVTEAPPNSKRVDGARVTITPLPNYIGPYQYLHNARKIDTIAHATVKKAEAVLLRTPGQVSSSLFRHIKKKQHPYGVEVVGDPYDVFAPGSVEHPLRCVFRWLGEKQLKSHCNGAIAAAYVTENALQRRYPNPFYSTHYSSIDIRKEAFVFSPRFEFGKDEHFRLVLIGSLEQLYKSPDILIAAVALCRTRNCKINVRIIGDGKFRTQLEEQVARLGLEKSVIFLGQLPAGDAVRKELLQADLFVLPSRTEGLPRAMIEAMACGLPCIGSYVGGIPELLPESDLVPPGDAQALAEKIEEVIANPERMRTMSARNLEKSKEYRNDILDQRRREFYSYLRQQTESWLTENKH